MQANSVRTDNDGYARFFVPTEAEYTIEAGFAGFKNVRLKHFHLSKPNAAFPTVYVQLQLLGSGTKVY